MDTNSKENVEASSTRKIKDPNLFQKVKEKYLAMKAKSGSHSPSALALQRAIPFINRLLFFIKSLCNNCIYEQNKKRFF